MEIASLLHGLAHSVGFYINIFLRETVSQKYWNLSRKSLLLSFFGSISISISIIIMSAQEAPVGYTNGTLFKWNTRGQVIAAATVLPALGLIEVTLRFWSRLQQKRSGAFGLDDAFMFPALVWLIFARQVLEDVGDANILRTSFASLASASPYSLVRLHLRLQRIY